MSLHTDKSKIETIAVIGAGPRGRAIAHATLLAGYKTILEDVSRQNLHDAAAWIKSALDQEPNDDNSERHQHAVVNNLSMVTTVEEALREADLVIEAAAEEMEVKIELFTIFDKFAKPGAILASSSPSLPIAEMASVTFYPERCIGMLFSGTDSHISMSELVPTAKTSKETVSSCREVVRRVNELHQKSAAARG